MKRPLLVSCSMCSHFDSNQAICSLNQERREAVQTKHAIECQKDGRFIRYMHVLPDSYNYYRLDEEIPGNWRYDMSRIPNDESGLPLFVITKRGMERAIPANENISMKSDVMFGVPRIMTYQGQREIIYELGVELAHSEAEKAGVELTVFREEQGWAGIESFILEYNDQQYQKRQSFGPWLSEKSNAEW